MQSYIRDTLDGFEEEIVSGGTALWKQDSGLRLVRRLKKLFENLVMDERERSRGRSQRSSGGSFGGVASTREVISLVDDDSG